MVVETKRGSLSVPGSADYGYTEYINCEICIHNPNHIILILGQNTGMRGRLVYSAGCYTGCPHEGTDNPDVHTLPLEEEKKI